MLLRRHNRSLLVRTPAKLNLYLEVLGKRADGYHDLESLMVKVSLFDDLTFSPAERVTLTTDLSRLEESSRIVSQDFCGPNNLILKAAEKLRRIAGFSSDGSERGVAIHLVKRIPLESGLAGGSSDAAATLIGLNEFWELGLSISELQALSSELGSDVPFFFTPSGAAICRGRGELVEPLPSGPRITVVVVRPPTGLSTPLVFKTLSTGSEKRSIAPIEAAWRTRSRSRLGGELFNRLQSPAEQLNRDVVRMREVFCELPFIAHQMSGSGTSYFGICQNLRQARRVAVWLRSQKLGSVFVAECSA